MDQVPPQPDSPPKARRPFFQRGWVIASITGTILTAGFFGLDRYYSPYGHTHCCNKAISGMLDLWAEEHGGKFPDAGNSAASLALLIRDPTSLKIIAGKASDSRKAGDYYNKFHTLPPELCSWHYVPGLRSDSPPYLALFWDTTGLSHAGTRTNPKRYEVSYVDGHSDLISESRWPAFIRQQNELLEEEMARQGK